MRAFLGRLAGVVSFGLILGGLSLVMAAAPKLGDKAADFELKTLDGASVQLSRLTVDGPVVVVVLRGYPGYQCPVCTAQVGDLIGKSKDIANAGARVVLIYPGPASQLESRASEFIAKAQLPPNFSFVIDPDYAFTNAYGLRWDQPMETAYPSTFVIDQKGVIRFAKVSRSHGGRARSSEILAALRTKK